jgi:hypothetical protein
LQAVGAACQRLEYLNLGNIDLGAVLHLFLRSPAKAGLPIKNPQKKTHPRKPTEKNPLKWGFWFFCFLFYFLFSKKIIQTFLFETDF